MTAITLFRLFASEYSAVSDDDVAEWMAQAELQLTPAPWGQTYGQAVVFLAAHMMTQIGPGYSSTPGGGSAGSSTGQLTSRTAGKTAESYGSAASIVAALGAKTIGEAELALTPYGQQFLRLMHNRGAHLPTFYSPDPSIGS